MCDVCVCVCVCACICGVGWEEETSPGFTPAATLGTVSSPEHQALPTLALHLVPVPVPLPRLPPD
jgi:hypothetical protein